MFIATGYEEKVNQILDYIKDAFLFHGDILTRIGNKIAQPEYIEYWSYLNGWIVSAAERLHRTDIIESAYNYLDMCSYENGSYFTHKIDTNHDDITDLLTTTHLGLLQLEHGNMERAVNAGNYLLEAVEKQSGLLKIYIYFWIKMII